MVEAKAKLMDGRTITVKARSFKGIARKLEKIEGMKNFTAKTVKRREPTHVLMSPEYYPFL